MAQRVQGKKGGEEARPPYAEEGAKIILVVNGLAGANGHAPEYLHPHHGVNEEDHANQ
jgi:hypothetical protein